VSGCDDERRTQNYAIDTILKFAADDARELQTVAGLAEKKNWTLDIVQF